MAKKILYFVNELVMIPDFRQKGKKVVLNLIIK